MPCDRAQCTERIAATRQSLKENNAERARTGTLKGQLIGGGVLATFNAVLAGAVLISWTHEFDKYKVSFPRNFVFHEIPVTARHPVTTTPHPVATTRHSREGGNPVTITTHAAHENRHSREGGNPVHSFQPEGLQNKEMRRGAPENTFLDSRLRGNDGGVNTRLARIKGGAER